MSKLRAFTLIEVLVSAAIGVLILATLVSTFIGARRTAARTETLARMHLDAAMIDRALQDEVESMHPCALVRLRSERRTAGDIAMNLQFASVMPSGDATATLGQAHAADVVWSSWYWSSSGTAGRPTLYRSRSSPFHYGKMRTAAGDDLEMLEFAAPRRDRRADLGANDGRGWAGMDVLAGSWYNAATRQTRFALPGDDNDLAANRTPFVVNIEDLAFAWIDRGGGSVRADAAGLTVRDATGAIATGAGSPPAGDNLWMRRAWWLADQAIAGIGRVDLLSLDGLWMDARPWRLGVSDPLPATAIAGQADSYPSTDARTSHDRRPALLRISFVLTDDPRPLAARDQDARWVRQRFTFSHPVAATLPRPLP